MDGGLYNVSEGTSVCKGNFTVMYFGIYRSSVSCGIVMFYLSDAVGGGF